MARARVAPEQQVRDRSVGVRLGPGRPTAGAAYVDNYLIAGCRRAKVQAVALRVEHELSSLGFVVHEQVDARRHASFVGLDFDGHEHSVRVSARRAWRLRFAIEEVLRRPKLSGQVLEIVVGHCTWVMLLKRCSLAIFDAVYAFVQAARDEALPLWPAVRRELWQMRSLLPLFVVFTDAPRGRRRGRADR